jgi:hypothetical protein
LGTAEPTREKLADTTVCEETLERGASMLAIRSPFTLRYVLLVFEQAGVYSRTLSAFFLEEERHEHP